MSQSARKWDARSALRFGKPASRVPDSVGLPPKDLPGGFGLPNDGAIESADTDWYWLRGVSLRGEGKRLSGGHRQDDLRVGRLGPSQSSPLAIAVADGVGGSDLSAIGARLACQAALTHLSDTYRDDGVADVRGLPLKVGGVLVRWADRNGVDSARLSTTLAVAVVERADAGGANGRILTVGDSGSSIVDNDGIRAVGVPEPRSVVGVFADTQTAALPLCSDDFCYSEQYLRPGTTLLCWTDGFEPLLCFSDSHNHFRSVFETRPPPAIAEFVWMVDARLKSYDDDRTVAAIWIR